MWDELWADARCLYDRYGPGGRFRFTSIAREVEAAGVKGSGFVTLDARGKYRFLA